MTIHPFEPTMYDDGIITYSGPKKARKVMKRLAADLGWEFKRVKKDSKADIIINFEAELSYGKYTGATGWCISRDGRSRVGVLESLPKYTRNIVLAHEVGHAFGLTHDDAGIMMPPSEGEEWSSTWFTSDHIATIHDIFQ